MAIPLWVGTVGTDMVTPTSMKSNGATGARGLTRGLATLPSRGIQELFVVRDTDALLLCVKQECTVGR